MNARIEHREPLPGYREPTSRWYEPYRTARDGVWRCNVRVRLSWRERQAGVLASVVAASETGVRRLMAQQDELAARVGQRPGPAREASR
ncbi:hypothetical protein [Actinomadura atramentaria]|uniref:hypothetical protein n=1 Tax=Actinomadura atramentaria TaxID=1990 RepID=UPI000380DD1C|nr:hypothetical protein [Actinomadura atramentaria]